MRAALPGPTIETDRGQRSGSRVTAPDGPPRPRCLASITRVEEEPPWTANSSTVWCERFPRTTPGAAGRWRGDRGGADRDRRGEGRHGRRMPGAGRFVPPGQPVLQRQVSEQRDVRARGPGRHVQPQQAVRLQERRMRLHQEGYRWQAVQLHLSASHLRRGQHRLRQDRRLLRWVLSFEPERLLAAAATVHTRGAIV